MNEGRLVDNELGIFNGITETDEIGNEVLGFEEFL
jgi:hypothetical protein